MPNEVDAKLCDHCGEALSNRRWTFHPACIPLVTERTCISCRVRKPLDAFALRNTTALGRRSSCRPCSSEYAMALNDANPDTQLNAHLLRKFGISLADFRALESAQGGVCAICQQPPALALGQRSRRQGRAVRPRLVVDHDHLTGKVRGLLCTPCNRGIGFLGDSSKRVAAALVYLEEASS